MSAETSSGHPTYGMTAMTRAQAEAMKKFFVPGRSRSRRKRHPLGKIRMLYRAPTRVTTASMSQGTGPIMLASPREISMLRNAATTKTRACCA